MAASATQGLRGAVRASWCEQYWHPFFNGTFAKISIDRLSGEALRRSGLCPRGSWSKYQPETLRVWRTLVPPVVEALRARPQHDILHEAMTIATFGVFLGDSLYFWRKQFPQSTLLGFDSFSGLPDEQAGQVVRRNWKRGMFDVTSGGNSAKLRQLTHRLHKDLGAAGGGEQHGQSRMIAGYFNESLTPELAASLSPFGIVDIDSDIYVSALQALDWIFAHSLVRVGSLIVYDDWMDYACAPRVPKRIHEMALRGSYSPNSKGRYVLNERGRAVTSAIHEAHGARRYGHLFSAGEPKAHAEMASKYGVTFVCVAGACAPPDVAMGSSSSSCDIHRPFGAVFLVARIGGSGAGAGSSAAAHLQSDHGHDHGAHMTNAELALWRSRNAHCAWMGRSVYSAGE